MKWFLTSPRNKCYIEELDDYSLSYVQFSINDETGLYLLNYSFTTHDQLASYQPKMIAVRTEIDDSNYLIDSFNKSAPFFTLVFLRSFEILIDKQEDSDKIDFSCAVSILLPLNENQTNIVAEYDELIQNLIYIKMVLINDESNQHVASNSQRQIEYHKKRTRRNNEEKVIRLLEIVIKQGPIAVNKETQTKHNNITCSCFLTLTDSDENRPKFEKTIFKLVDTTILTSKSSMLMSSNLKFFIFISIFLIIAIFLIVLRLICFCNRFLTYDVNYYFK